MKRNVNLLPLPFRRRAVVRQRATQWSFVLGIALVGCGVTWLFEYTAYAKIREQVETFERRGASVRCLAAETRVLRIEMQELTDRQGLAGVLARRHSMLGLLGVVSSSAQQTQGRIRVDGIVMQAEGVEDAVTNGQWMLRLTGVGAGSQAIARFVRSLRDANVFKRVDLKSTSHLAAPEQLRSYEIECRY